MEKRRIYLCVDLKSFYASVECVERGLDALTAKLVVADASRTDKTICLAVSPALKGMGVKNRCRLFEIPKDIDYLIAVPRMQLYMDYSARIYSIYLRYIAKEDIHVYSIDECFMDITSYLPYYGKTPRELAQMLIREVLKETGITATAGIGTNLYLAKIAMDIVAKKTEPDENGVRIAQLDQLSYRRLLWDHRPLTDFWRIGPGTARRLARRCIFTMGDIARASLYDEEGLYRLFGVDAELLIDHAWGEESCTMADIKAYRPRTNSISSGQVLPCPYPSDKAAIIVREMTELLVLELVDRELATDSITLTIGYDRTSMAAYSGTAHIDHYGRAVPKPAHGTATLNTATSSTARIVRAVMGLFGRIVDPSLLVRRVTLNANNLTKAGCEQYDLFTDPVKLEQEKRMQRAMVNIQKRYGKNALLKGTNYLEGATTRERNRQIGGHKA